jgi:hypothetical protein
VSEEHAEMKNLPSLQAPGFLPGQKRKAAKSSKMKSPHAQIFAMADSIPALRF